MLSKTQLKYIQSLGQKKCRDEEALFIAEGPKLVAELLNEKQVNARGVYALRHWIEANPAFAPSVTEISETELEKISQLKTPNQVLMVAEKIKWENEPAVKNTITLILDIIQDPGNLGTIIRLADWFGISRVVCSNDSADIYNPKVVQASMGSIARVRVDYLSLPEFIKQHSGIKTYAAALDGEQVSAMKKITEGFIIIGNESKGISPEMLQLANIKITIGGRGKAESLNAAVATGIILSHLCSS